MQGRSNYLRRAQREPISTLAATGRFRSGQTGQTVNLLALRLRWFESSPAQFYPNGACASHADLVDGVTWQIVVLSPHFASGSFGGARRFDGREDLFGRRVVKAALATGFVF